MSNWKCCEWCGMKMTGIVEEPPYPGYKPLGDDPVKIPIRTICEECEEENKKK